MVLPFKNNLHRNVLTGIGDRSTRNSKKITRTEKVEPLSGLLRGPDTENHRRTPTPSKTNSVSSDCSSRNTPKNRSWTTAQTHNSVSIR